MKLLYGILIESPGRRKTMKTYSWWCDDCSSLRQYSNKPDDDGSHIDCSSIPFPLDHNYIRVDDSSEFIREEEKEMKTELCKVVRDLKPKGIVLSSEEEARMNTLNKVEEIIKRYEKE